MSYPLGWLVVLAGAKDAGLQVNGLLLSCLPSLVPLCAEELLCALACASVRSPVSHRLSLELVTGAEQKCVGSRDVASRWLSSEWLCSFHFWWSPTLVP